MSPIRFYFAAGGLAVVTWVAAVIWNRWYIRRLLVREFVKQLWLEHRGHQPYIFLKRK